MIKRYLRPLGRIRASALLLIGCICISALPLTGCVSGKAVQRMTGGEAAGKTEGETAAAEETSAETGLEAGDGLTDRNTEEESRVTRLSVGSSTAIVLPDRIECSDGTTLEILKYPDGILGSDSDLLRGCQADTVSVFIGSATVATDVVPELALLSIPYLIDGFENYQKALQEEWLEWFQPYYQAQGLQLLAWRATYAGCLLSQIPIQTAEDFKRLNIRTMKNPYREAYWSAMGAHVLPLSYDEIGYYLQTKQLNTLEAGLSAMVRSGYVEKFEYLIPLDHIPALSSVVMNKDAYDRLTAAQQEAILSYADMAVREEDILTKCVEKYQLTVLEPGAELKRELINKRQAVIELLKGTLDEKLVDEFLEEINHSS